MVDCVVTVGLFIVGVGVGEGSGGDDVLCIGGGDDDEGIGIGIGDDGQEKLAVRVINCMTFCTYRLENH